MSALTCERCGADVPSVDITRFGDRERVRIATEPCACSPRCPLCETLLALGKCWNVECVLAGQVVPDREA